MTTEWRVCSDGVSSPHATRISEEEAQRYLKRDNMNGLWIERREVTPWERVDPDV